MAVKQIIKSSGLAALATGIALITLPGIALADQDEGRGRWSHDSGQAVGDGVQGRGGETRGGDRGGDRAGDRGGGGWQQRQAAPAPQAQPQPQVQVQAQAAPQQRGWNGGGGNGGGGNGGGWNGGGNRSTAPQDGGWSARPQAAPATAPQTRGWNGGGWNGGGQQSRPQAAPVPPPVQDRKSVV